VAQKLEEFFPEAHLQEEALEFYARVARCAPTPETERARFRGSLLSIWMGSCVRAVPWLRSLSEDRKSEFHSRSLFWLARCSQKVGDKLGFEVARQKLLKEHPLSFHSIILFQNEPKKLARVMEGPDPEVLFRSREKPESMDSIRTIEAMLSFGERDLAKSMLQKTAPLLEGTEPEFRLYLAELFERAGDPIGRFRWLGSALREKPTLVTLSTLKAFYPLRRFEILERHSNLVDPLFTAALIRQESGFHPQARSPVGALGLMQIMPATARRMERVSRFSLLDPSTNVRLGTRFLHGLLERFDRNADLALAGYNAGPHRVDQWKRRYPMEDRILFLDFIPFKETRDYVSLIGRNYYWYLALYSDFEPAAKLDHAYRALASSSELGGPLLRQKLPRSRGSYGKRPGVEFTFFPMPPLR
jgi:soluble lytic murein transglycosylase